MSKHLDAAAAAPLTAAELAQLGHRDDCIMPVPKDAGVPQGKLHGREADRRFAYKDADGNILGYVLRWHARNGTDKDIRPVTYWRNGDGKGSWRLKTWPGSRPLFGLDQLAAHPDAIVLLTEGEKAAEAVERGPLADAFKWAKQDVIGMTWPGGTNAIGHADFSPLAGRDVIVLPDHDQPGEAAADALVDVLAKVGVHRLRRWHAPAQAREKWDIADTVPDGVTPELIVKSMFDAPVIGPRQEPAPLLQWLDMSNWDNEPRPEREWAILNRVPLKQAGLFSGEGGAGKSILEMMKDVAHVTGKDWLGSMPMPGPAWYIGAEDDEKEIHIRFHDIAVHYGVTFKELVDGGLRVLCLLGQDATLCAVGKSGRVETTDLYRQLYEAAGDIKPKNISIDTLSRAFAGSEIDRVQVYAFAMHMQALAMVANGSVTVLSHPSLSGISSGTGLSGSTAWHGAFRFRQYLKSVRAEGGEQPDNDLREIEFKKNQYGPRGETIVLRYQRGLFLPVAAVGSLDKLAADQAADNLFLELLDKFRAQGRNVSHHRTANTYAPTMFSKDPKAKAPGMRTALADAMERLFTAQKIKVEEYGRPSNPHTRLARC